MTAQVAVGVEIDGAVVHAGTAYFSRRRGSVSTTFRYVGEYLAHPGAYAIDPNLSFTHGTPTVDGLPGAFQDSSPDRWGRNLIAKRIRVEAITSGNHPVEPDDVAFLLGVDDLTRQGALRFSAAAGGPYLATSVGVPKLVELPELRRAAEAVSKGDDNFAAVKDLLDAGTGSLGGARPKASVRDDDNLLIAKFGHPNDEWNVSAWEKTALDLAASAGISVPNSKLVQVGEHSVLLLDRFDRVNGKRIGFMSTMTLLSAHDGDHRDYVDIAEALTTLVSHPTEALHALWRRVAFSVAIHNTDDHLRNHGFLRARQGWELSPVFDVNPNPDLAGMRQTSIGGYDSVKDEIEGLLTSAPAFGLTDSGARRILGEVGDALTRWRLVAQRNGIRESELVRFAPTLEHTVGMVTAAAQG